MKPRAFGQNFTKSQNKAVRQNVVINALIGKMSQITFSKVHGMEKRIVYF